jgi:hypothetical protein
MSKRQYVVGQNYFADDEMPDNLQDLQYKIKQAADELTKKSYFDKLKAEDQVERYSLAAKFRGEVLDLENQLAAAKEEIKTLNKAIKEKQLAFNLTFDDTAKGIAPVETNVAVIFDHAAGKAVTVEVNTGLVKDLRTLTSEERQLGLPLSVSHKTGTDF